MLKFIRHFSCVLISCISLVLTSTTTGATVDLPICDIGILKYSDVKYDDILLPIEYRYSLLAGGKGILYVKAGEEQRISHWGTNYDAAQIVIYLRISDSLQPIWPSRLSSDHMVGVLRSYNPKEHFWTGYTLYSVEYFEALRYDSNPSDGYQEYAIPVNVWRHDDRFVGYAEIMIPVLFSDIPQEGTVSAKVCKFTYTNSGEIDEISENALSAHFGAIGLHLSELALSEIIGYMGHYVVGSFWDLGKLAVTQDPRTLIPHLDASVELVQVLGRLAGTIRTDDENRFRILSESEWSEAPGETGPILNDEIFTFDPVTQLSTIDLDLKVMDIDGEYEIASSLQMMPGYQYRVQVRGISSLAANERLHGRLFVSDNLEIVDRMTDADGDIVVAHTKNTQAYPLEWTVRCKTRDQHLVMVRAFKGESVPNPDAPWGDWIFTASSWTDHVLGLIPDNEPPDATVVAPAEMAIVSGSAYVQATAADNIGVKAVFLVIDGFILKEFDSVGSDTYMVEWDTTVSGEGYHEIEVIAWDTSDNTVTSEPIIVKVDNSLTLTHNGPWSASTSGTFVISGSLKDVNQSGKPGVFVYAKIDGSIIGHGVTDSLGNYTIANVTAPANPGPYTIQLEATYNGQVKEESGNLTVTSPSDGYEIRISNFTVEPFSLEPGERVTIRATVDNISSKTGVISGDLIFKVGTQTSPPYPFSRNQGQSTGSQSASFYLNDIGTHTAMAYLVNVTSGLAPENWSTSYERIPEDIVVVLPI